MIPAHLVEFLSGGVSVVVGTRDASLMPESTRAWGVRVEPDHGSVTLFVTESISRRTLENIEENGMISIACSRPATHEACQLKGKVRKVRSADRSDDACWREWLEKFKAEIAIVGTRTDAFEILRSQQFLAIEVGVTDVFSATPGPKAGARI